MQYTPCSKIFLFKTLKKKKLLFEVVQEYKNSLYKRIGENEKQCGKVSGYHFLSSPAPTENIASPCFVQ